MGPMIVKFKICAEEKLDHLLKTFMLCIALCTLKSIEVRRAASSDALALRVVAVWGHHDKQGTETTGVPFVLTKRLLQVQVKNLK